MSQSDESNREGGQKIIDGGGQGDIEHNDEESQGNISEHEEEQVLEENLEHLNKFLANLYERGLDRIPQRSVGKLKEMKEKWREVMSLTEDSDNGSNSEVNNVKDKLEAQRGKVKSIGTLQGPSTSGTGNKIKSIMKVKRETRVNANSSSEINDSCDSSLSDPVSEISSDTEMSDDGDPKKGKRNKVKRTKSKTKCKSKKKSQRVVREAKEVRGGSLAKALAKLDSRKVPEQEKFDEKSGEDLRDYLFKFESYCRDNFRGDSRFWIGELRRNLSGKILDAFESMKTVNTTYEELKDQLLVYYDDMKELRKEKNRLAFKNAQHKRGESLYLFSARLEKMFKVAYPKHQVSTSKTLQQKFLASIPKVHRSVIETQIMMYTVMDKKMTWKVIQKISSLKDVENEKAEVKEEEVHEEKEIIINVGQESVKRGRQEQKPIAAGQNLRYTGRTYYSSKYDTNNYGHSRQLERNRTGHSDYSRGAHSSRQLDRGREQTNSNPRNGTQNRIRISMRPPSHLRATNVICFWCKRVGHKYEECRYRLRQCYICGANNHYFRECPRNRNHRAVSMQPINRSRRDETEGKIMSNRNSRNEQSNFRHRTVSSNSNPVN